MRKMMFIYVTQMRNGEVVFGAQRNGIHSDGWWSISVVDRVFGVRLHGGRSFLDGAVLAGLVGIRLTVTAVGSASVYSVA